MNPHTFRSKADHVAIAKGYPPKPANKRRGYRHPVPQLPRPNPRAEEREYKRRLKAGGESKGHYNPRRAVTEIAPGFVANQTGHRPNCRSRGAGANHRNWIWPEGKVAKPGRMG